MFYIEVFIFGMLHPLRPKQLNTVSKRTLCSCLTADVSRLLGWSTTLVQTEISQQLLDGSLWNLVQMSIVPTECMQMTWLIPWLFTFMVVSEIFQQLLAASCIVMKYDVHICGAWIMHPNDVLSEVDILELNSLHTCPPQDDLSDLRINLSDPWAFHLAHNCSLSYTLVYDLITPANLMIHDSCV